MKNIRKGVNLVKTANQKVDCGNYGTCCYNISGHCCQS